MTAPRLLRHPLAAALFLFAAILAIQPVASASAAISGVDLSSYLRVGRHDLPPQVAPDNQLAEEASAVTYNWDTDTLFVVGDEGTSVVQVSKTGTLINSMKLSGFEDTEGLTYLGGGKFALTEERLRKIDRFTYTPNTTLQRDGGSVDQVKLGTTIGNIGLEGVSNDPQTGGVIVVKESGPRGIFATVPNWAAGTASVDGPAVDNPPNLFDPDAIGLSDLSDVYALANVQALAGTADQSHLLIISQESGKVVNVSRSGVVSSTLTIVADAGSSMTVPEMTMEGVTMDADGNLYVVNEQGGGAGIPQMWVYQPSSTPNAAPTGVTLNSVLSSIPENASTAARTKVANVAVTDDGLGTNDLSVTGPDASSFEVDNTGLYLKAGVALDHASKPSYQVSVAVDDAGVGASPDATSTPFTLTVTVASSGPGSTSVRVTEVAPWGSGDASYQADWFELTNTGDTTVDLSGWKMDDDSNAYGNAVALNGVPSLAPGESAIFVQGDADTPIEFKQSWFGANPPAGLQVGTFADSGTGLSTGGDQVNIFDNLGTHVTGVKFGASTTKKSFDNAAGVETVTTLSADGTGGAFTSPESEVGSPGLAPAPVEVTEVAPWGSGTGSYTADWFELTNTASYAVSLAGWKMDDSSNSLALAVPLAGVPSLAPGESAVFVQGDAAKVAAFESGWFGSSVPPGLQVGTFIDSGTGLSNGGDAVNIFDAHGARVFGVTFGTATDKVSFDNSAGDASVTALSAVGTNGAFTSATNGEVGSPGRVASPAATGLKITEVAPWGSGNGGYAADWFEVTNTGTTAVDLTGWKMDDSSNAFATAVVLNGVTSLAPGESAIFLEGDATNVAAFRTAWATPAGLQIGTYGGSGVGLSGSGDAVNLFSAFGDPITGVSFGAQTDKVSFDNKAGDATVTTLSAVGINGAYTSGSGETGSPGLTATPASTATAKVTEVAPWGSGNGGYGADWFELTNTGSSAIDLTGWKMDDSSDAYGTAVALNGVTSLAPGESVIFLEGDATTPAVFKTAWFGANVPAGLQVGWYGGSGVGLSTGGDGVAVFDSLGRRVTKVSFGASTDKVSFDNKAGDATVTALSAVGTNGAFTSATGGEVGSPGTTVTPAPPSNGGGGGGSTTPPVTTPTDSAPSSTPPSPPAGGGTTPPARPTTPSTPSTPETPSKPDVSVPHSVKPGQLAKGVKTTLADLDPGSRITIEIRSGGKKLKTVKAKANAKGDGSVKLKLTKKQIAKLGDKLTVRYTVVGADGKKRTLTQTIDVR